MRLVTDRGMRTPRLYAVSITVFAFGIAALALCARAYPPALDLRLVLVMAGAAFSEAFRLALPGYTLGLAYPLSMAAAVFGGPAAACLVSLVSAVGIGEIREKVPVTIMLFNAGQLLLGSAAGGYVYVAMGGRVLLTSSGEYVPLGLSDFPAALIGMTAAAVASWGVNMVLTAGGVAAFRGASFRAVAASGLQIAPSQIALAFVGYLMAQVLAIAAVALPLFIFPLVVAREFYQRYVSLRDAYSDTIKSLVGALEAKDSYTRGHSVRVAEYSAQIGAEMGLSASQLESLEYAALLHDLGKLSLSSEILTKPSVLTTDEMNAMRNHPTAGAQLVERIPFLKGLVVHIAAHHEWYNGEGYPKGAHEHEIPDLARILSVADAFDAMTTNRAYRDALAEEKALDEILDGRGSQFDPAVVDAFFSSREAINALREAESAVAEQLMGATAASGTRQS